jgi:hypothetical protein
MDWLFSYTIWSRRKKKETAECENTNKQMDWLFSYTIWSWRKENEIAEW